MSFLVACRSCRLSVRIARRIVLTFSECSLYFAKIMQTSRERACSWFPECRLSYAKMMKGECRTNNGKHSFTLLDTAEPHLILCKDNIFYPYICSYVSFFVVRNAWRNACKTQSAYCIQRGNEYLCTFSGDCFLQNKIHK